MQSPLLTLPTELRLQIYTYALTAPSHALRIYHSYQSPKTAPNLSLSLLRTCSQIHREAQPILYDVNTVFVAADIHQMAYPAISTSQLPPHVLPRIRHMFAVLDGSDSFPFGYEDVDWRPFQALTGLKTLRVAVVMQEQQLGSVVLPAGMMSYVVERVPRDCVIEFGAVSEPERQYVSLFVKKGSVTMFRSVELAGETLREAYDLALEETPRGYTRKCCPGSRSGSTQDHRDYNYEADMFAQGPRTW